MYTKPYDPDYDRDLPWPYTPDEHMTWDEVGRAA